MTWRHNMSHCLCILLPKKVSECWFSCVTRFQVSRANRKYILAQGPLPSTVGHFWLTVWQRKSKAVLMLNRVIEKGQLKCHQYWPVTAGESMDMADVNLSLSHVESKPGQHYTVRTLRLVKSFGCGISFFYRQILFSDSPTLKLMTVGKYFTSTTQHGRISVCQLVPTVFWNSFMQFETVAASTRMLDLLLSIVLLALADLEHFV